VIKWFEYEPLEVVGWFRFSLGSHRKTVLAAFPVSQWHY